MLLHVFSCVKLSLFQCNFIRCLANFSFFNLPLTTSLPSLSKKGPVLIEIKLVLFLILQNYYSMFSFQKVMQNVKFLLFV
ncbi:hypothetical protein LM13656_220044 [Listeria monocytogenes]|nr:hypothetical protein LM1000505_200013 [Listeria monocytogenes]CUK37339.1 hypothetical protein LM13656_220044 [Listeria monocytogenes]CUK39212.1 hypothetical protein LM500008_40103 [Listeria monocytogenes]CUK47150.1 hypothetical protein LM500190_50023 [Listeria monocytogenes]CUL06794.1 hypothetical protein LM701337_120044 [Listeria monocytogenes]